MDKNIIYDDYYQKVYNLQQENKQLKETIENIKDFNNKLQASKDRLDKDDYNLAHILTELEEWCKDGIKDELFKFDYGTKIIGEPIKIHITSYEMVLDKIHKLKEKYKC